MTSASSTSSAGARDGAGRLVLATLAINALLSAAILAAYFATRSHLVLAQGIDSIYDLVAGLVLTWSARIGRRPRDLDHPFGHQRAEPIGALAIAVLTGVLAFEVFRGASAALISGEHVALAPIVALVLGAKLAVKLVWYSWLARARAAARSSALDATAVDARNDVVACASSLCGYGLSRLGWDAADAALALPVAVYVAWNGLRLAQDNVRYLMGAAPPDGVLDELRARAARVPGVLGVGELRVQYHGRELHVQIEIVVAESLSATAGHDIGVAVQRALEAEPQVGETFVHVDTPAGRPHA